MPNIDLSGATSINGSDPSQGKIDAKVTPEMATFIMLDELNTRMAEFVDLTKQAFAEGKERSWVVNVTPIPQEVEFFAKSYTLFNDGNSTVFTQEIGDGTLNTISTENAGLEAGDDESVQLGRKTLVRFRIACPSGGSAIVRIRAHY